MKPRGAMLMISPAMLHSWYDRNLKSCRSKGPGPSAGFNAWNDRQRLKQCPGLESRLLQLTLAKQCLNPWSTVRWMRALQMQQEIAALHLYCFCVLQLKCS